jgi:RNA polymerase sigma-70 factor, ECF subfamily
VIESDAALMRKTAAGDRDALEGLVDRYERAVFRLAQAIAPEHAEDIAQETFLAVWRNAATFSGDESARPWILTIARNAAYRLFRRRAGEPEDPQPLSELGAEVGWAAHDPRIAERLADREIVEIGFRGLTPEEREMVMLRDVEEFSGEEVASMLGLTLAAAKSRLHRARLRFLKNVRETNA